MSHPHVALLVLLTLGATGALTRALPAAPQTPTTASTAVRLRDLPELASLGDYGDAAVPLSELLQRLQASTGVRLSVGAPELKEQKLSLYARQQPAGLLLDQIAACLGAIWEPWKEKEYRLVLGPETRAYRTRYWDTRQRRARLVDSARFKRFRAAIRRALTEAAPPGGSPTPAAGTTPAPGSSRSVEMLGVLRLLSQSDLMALIRAGDRAWRVRTRTGELIAHTSKLPAFSVRLSQLPPAEQQRFQAFLSQQSGEGPGARYSALGKDPAATLHFCNFVGDGIGLSVTSERIPGSAPQFQLLAGIDRKGDELSGDLTAEEKAAFRVFQQERRQGWRFPLLPGRLTGLTGAEAHQSLKLDLERERDAAPVRPFAEVLRLLHRATNRTIVADAFSSPDSRIQLQPQASPQELLQAICREFGRDARVSPEAITFRSTTWPEDILASVSVAQLRSWSAHKQEHGDLPAEDWLELGRLSRVQLLGLALGYEPMGETLAEEAVSALRGYPVLQYYHQLTPLQQARARRGGVYFRELSPAQRQTLLLLASTWEGPVLTPATLNEGFRLWVETPSTVAPESPESLNLEPPDSERLICGVRIRLAEGVEHLAELMATPTRTPRK